MRKRGDNTIFIDTGHK